MKKILAVIVVVLALGGGYVYYTPYSMTGKLTEAVKKQDTATVSEFVDFASVKTSVSEQMQKAVTQKLMSDPAMRDNPMSSLAMGLATQMVDGLSSIIASPEGITKFLGGVNPLDKNGGEQTAASRLEKGQKEYIDSSHFQITTTDEQNRTVKFIFERDGLTNWKMKKIIFPEELLNP